MAGVIKINLKNLKIYLWLDDLMQETIWSHQIYRNGRFEPLADSGRSLTWAYKLKALKSSLRVFTYFVITEGGGGSLKCLYMIIGKGEGVGLMMTDISKNNSFHKVK